MFAAALPWPHIYDEEPSDGSLAYKITRISLVPFYGGRYSWRQSILESAFFSGVITGDGLLILGDRRLPFAVESNVVWKRAMLSVRAIYVLSPLQLS